MSGVRVTRSRCDGEQSWEGLWELVLSSTVWALKVELRGSQLAAPPSALYLLNPLIYLELWYLPTHLPGLRNAVKSLLYIFKIFYFWFMSVRLLPACVCVPQVPSARRGQKKVSRLPGSGVTDVCELPCGCLEWKLCPLKEKSVLLTTKPVLQPQKCIFSFKY